MDERIVLVVDDESAVRALVVSALSLMGYRAIEARNGQEALKLAGRTQVDLVLTDVVMPGMSGPELVAEFERRGSKAHYLFMSGYATAGDPTGGRIPLLPKPFTLEGLAGAVRSAMENAAGNPAGGAADPRGSRPGPEAMARLRAAGLEYRRAVRDRAEAIREAQAGGGVSDADGAQSLHELGTVEREALAKYIRQANALSGSVRHREAEKPGPVQTPADGLTPRETQVLQLIAAGLPTRLVASRLGIAFKTVACHRAHIMEKLGAHDVTGLVHYAIRHKLIEL